MSSSNSLRSALLACAVVFAAPSALADADAKPSAADVNTAKVAFAEGTDLRAAGDLPRDLERLRAAYAAVPTPITGLEVGRTLAQMNRPSEARAALRDAANMPPSPTESERAKQARAEAAKLAAELDAKVATLDVRADPDAESITVDDKPVANAREPVIVDPGHHVVVARARGGREGRAEIDAGAGERKEVRVTSAAPEPRTHLRIHPATWVGVTMAGVGLLGGAITGAAAFATASGLKTSCPNNLCPPSAHGAHDTSLALGTVSTVGFILAGAGAVVGVVGLLLSKRVADDAPVALEVGPASLAVRGTF